ncbi:MAG: hypothetical protein WBA11_11340, partial [Rubrivirga sp.]
AEVLSEFGYPAGSRPRGRGLLWGPRPSRGSRRLVLDVEAVPPGLDVAERRVAPDTPVSFSPRRFLPRETVVLTLPNDVPQ